MIKVIKKFLLRLTIMSVIFFNISCYEQKIPQNVESKVDLYTLIKDIKIIDSTRAILQEKFFYELAKEAGKKDTIDWKIPYSIWMVESKMDPNAKGDGKKDANGIIIPGSERAFGLGQIHVPTAKTHGNSKITKEDLLDPVINGFTCVSVLRDYSKMFNGNILYTIAAYNAGPVPVKEDYKNRKAPRNWQYVNAVYEFYSKIKEK